MQQETECLKSAESGSSELLSILAHEIRNPLAAVVNGVQVLRQVGTDSALAEQVLDLIDRQLGQILHLMDDLLQPHIGPAEAPARTPSEDIPEIDNRSRPLSVLVVEDNRDVAKSLTSLLRLWGHEVFAAYDGLQALPMAERYQPQIVLLDLDLPGLDGYGVAQRLRERPALKQMKLVAVTAFGDQDHRARVSASGFDSHLIKPVAPWALKQLLASIGNEVRPVG